MMKTFLICPIRNATQKEISYCEGVVKSLEDDGYDVHWPYRDTDQTCDTGLEICRENNESIKNADVVHIVYEPSSTGSHFDIGCAFAHNKKIIPIRLPELTEGKSFQNMITAWSCR